MKDRLVIKVLSCTGIDLSRYRPEVVEKGVRLRMDALGMARPDTYIPYLGEDETEGQLLVEAMLVHVSGFFRNPIVFETIGQKVLPALMETPGRMKRDIRVWCPGCAEGEEPYSIAILARETAAQRQSDSVFHIFATDLSSKALERAKEGRYPAGQLENIRFGWVARYFDAEPGRNFRLRSIIRSMVHFSLDDLTQETQAAPADSIFGGFDLILCRNVLIYLEPSRQVPVLAKLVKTLNPSGFLVLGDAEALPEEMKRAMRVVDPQNRIYQKVSNQIKT